ncbi:Zinc finger BED domain-containing protein RICESLEEPER 2 [Pseudolycoriella hygida]|uniref:Zinc finger BED domain-containing protein RICESLEEPER 2 n=1 Tax=Pseudolycoriella hygida TaxID=35572 RepID=A0A9Q0S110_9DIPT|nr:Zinc finger BED domain-containing protein RICESLEEPER 2 [Pseudolycoriella hygida]
MELLDGEDQVYATLSDVDGDDIDETIGANLIVSQRKKLMWSYFEDVIENGDRYGKCKLCKSGSGTGNMQRHLKRDHAREIVSGTLTAENGTGAFVFSQEAFRAALIKWIVLCDQPFTEPQQQSFVELVHSLNPDAKLITDKTVKADILETYEAKLEDLKVLLSQIPGKLSISLDGWTSRNILPFLAIRGHWYDANWDYHSFLFDFSYIHGKHSGWKHSCIFRDCLSRLNIAITKILGVTGDNAGSNDTFFDWMEEYGLTVLSNKMRCICHIFNLAVQDFLTLLKVTPPEDNDIDADDDDFENEVIEHIDIDEEISVDEDDTTYELPVDNAHIIKKLRKIVKAVRKSKLAHGLLWEKPLFAFV